MDWAMCGVIDFAGKQQCIFIPGEITPRHFYCKEEGPVALAQAVSAQTPLHCKFHLGLSGSLFVTSHSEVVPYLVIGVA